MGYCFRHQDEVFFSQLDGIDDETTYKTVKNNQIMHAQNFD